MTRPPAFWREDGFFPRALSPVAAVVAAVAARRATRPGTRLGARVICCGNATVGGAGKTPLALDLAARAHARGKAVAFLTRGHGGRATGVVRVDRARHDAGAVGDEALLLAALAPTFVGADRVAAARAAIAAGAGLLVMDDGLQNFGLAKDFSFLVIDGPTGFGNGRVLPAGPLREPPEAAAARCHAAVVIGAPTAPGLEAFLARLPIPVFSATLVTEAPPGRLVAFAGIGRPEKFFAGLRAAGADLVATRGFPDHHRYATVDLAALSAWERRENATLVTTAKDAVRLPPEFVARVVVAPARLAWRDPTAIEAMLDRP